MIIIEKVSFKGLLTEIKYHSNESNWGVYYFDVIGTNEFYKQNNIICCKGIIYNPSFSEQYDIHGTIDIDPVYGEQITIDKAIPIAGIKNENIRGQKYILRKFFTNNIVNEMYKALDNPYEALLNKDYETLCKVKGCGLKTAIKWVERFHENLSKHKIYLEVARFGLTDKIIDKIFEWYKYDSDKIIHIIKNNPYKLLEINGIGWRKADSIAMASGLDKFSIERISAGLVYFLKEQGENGKSYCYPDEIMADIVNRIGEDVPDLNITEAIHDLKKKDIIIWNEDKTRIGLKYYYDLEKKISEHLIRLRDAPNKFEYSNWETIIKEKEKKQGWEYTEQQLEGIKMVLENQVCCISGYGGTGKTSIIDGILSILKDYRSITVALAGRAASRITETSGAESKTIHMLLHLNYKNNKTAFDYKENPLDYDIVVVDEMSMIDGRLYFQLLKSIGSGTKVIFIGDIGQLESIGCCSVAADMITSKYIKSIFLDKIHRQAQKSAIITESIKVRKGIQIISQDWAGEEVRGELRDMILDCYTDKTNTYHKIVRYFKEELKRVDSILDLQIVVPNKKGIASVSNLNKMAQSIYNPQGKNIKVYSQGETWILREGDKVINKKNCYDIQNKNGSIHNIFNGNIGILKKICEGYIIIDFQSIGLVEVPQKHYKHIELGYAITCHSAQGSQFPVVIGGIDYSMYVMLNRELLYTMMTRASEKFILIAQNSALRYAISQYQIIKRQTYLIDMLDDLNKTKYDF